MIKRRDLIVFQFICNIFFAINFILQSVNHGFEALSCLLIVILCAYILIKKNNNNEKNHFDELVTILFITFMIILIQTKLEYNIYDKNNLPLMASILIVYALTNNNIRMMKIEYFFVGLLWILYDISDGDIANTYNQILLLCSIIGSFLLYDVLKLEDTMANYFSKISISLKNMDYQLWK
jgi:uncharacterized membrane protein